MEQIKVIKHTNGDRRCQKNVINYPIGKDQILEEYLGVSCNDSHNANIQFTKIAEFFNNSGKTPVIHYVVSYTKGIAPTAEKAMELTKQVLKPITDTHATVIGIHCKEHEKSEYHAHSAVSPTDVRDGSLLYCDNKTNYALAQRVANVTGEPTQLTVRNENGTEWKCPRIFIPQSEEE